MFSNLFRRKITDQMAAWHQRLEELPDNNVSRADALSALRQGRRALGLTRQQTELLAYLASKTRPEAWTSPGCEPISTARNAAIEREFDIGRTRVKTLLRGLAESGFISFRDSSNGVRYSLTLHDGQRTAYGISLQPLSKRYAEFVQAIEESKARLYESQRLHNRLYELTGRIYELSKQAPTLGLCAEDVAQIGRQAHELFSQKPRDKDPTILAKICAKLETLLNALKALFSAKKSVESDPKGPLERPHYTNTNIYKNISVENGAGSARTAQEKPSSKKSLSSPLRGFRASPQWLSKISPDLKKYCSDDPTENEISYAALLATQDLGISRHAWQQAVAILGQYETAVAIALISAKKTAGKIRSAGGYLRGLVEKQLSGELNLDRSLYGLHE